MVPSQAPIPGSNRDRRETDNWFPVKHQYLAVSRDRRETIIVNKFTNRTRSFSISVA